MKLILSRAAEDEAAEARAWYDAQRPGLGKDFLDSLDRLLPMIESAPRSFSRANDYKGTRDVRKGLLRRFPYKVIFEIRADETLVVLAVAHSSRRPSYWQDRVH